MAIDDRFNRVAQRCATKLGQTVVIDGRAVIAIVDESVQFVNNAITATITTVSVPKSLIEKPSRGDIVTYNDVSATVAKVEPDGPDWLIILK
jgi:hypothetical protein